MNLLFQLKDQLLKPRTMIVVWLIVALSCGIVKTFSDHNNFLIFKGVAQHLFNSMPLYTSYPSEYFDLNHYGPFFAIIIAPFAYLPVWLGMPLWVTCMAGALCWAVMNLPISNKWKSVILLISANDLLSASMMQQFNIAIAAILVGSFVLIEKRKEGWAAILIVIGLFTKIYGIVGLAFFFFVKRKWRFILHGLIWCCVMLILPLLFVDASYLWGEYSAWFTDITTKSEMNHFAFSQNISLLGFVRKVSGCTTYSDLLLFVPATLLFGSVYLRFRQFKNAGFRMMLLACVMIFVVIFSNGSENSGYIVATIGVGIWWVNLQKRGWINWTLLVLVLIASFGRNLLPVDSIYDPYFMKYSLRAVPFALVWISCLWHLWRDDFSVEQAAKKDCTNSDIDIVLPCYNPDNEWVERAAKNFKQLQNRHVNHKMRLFVSNDGSTRNFGAEFIDKLKVLVPDVVVVDNKTNRGKGAAVRAGVAQTNAELVVYTDYDFPYRQECMSKVITELESGVDVVLACRNHTYRSELGVFRRFLSWASKNMNWLILGMGYPDAQGGLKGFNNNGRQIFLQTKVNRFLFDTEFIYKASKRPDVTISEVIVNLREGVVLPPMKMKTMKQEALNFVKIILRG